MLGFITNIPCDIYTKTNVKAMDLDNIPDRGGGGGGGDKDI